MTRLPPRRAAWMLLLPLLAALPAAAGHTPAAPCACTPRPAAGPSETLALRPGAKLAAPRILTVASPARGLRQARQDLTPAPGQQSSGPVGTARPSTSPTESSSLTAPSATSVFPPQAAAPSATPHASDTPHASARPTPSPAAQPSPGPHFLPVSTTLGIGALAAAALTAALAARRARRTRPAADAPASAHTTHTEADFTRLERALHALTRDEDGNLPAVRAALLTSHTVRLLPDTSHTPPPPPFTDDPDGWWTLPHSTDLPDEAAARQPEAPYPALVTIGHTPSGDLMLLNLARTPAVLLDGQPDHITEVCTSLALELAMSPWAGRSEIVTVGFGEDLPQLLPGARITHLRNAAHARRDLSERLLEAHQMPGTPHPPYVLLCTSTLDAGTARELAGLIGKTATLPVTLIAPAHAATPHFPEADILDASLSGPQPLHSTGTDIILQRLDQADFLQITTALAAAGQDTAQEPQYEGHDETGPAVQPEPPAQSGRRTAQDTLLPADVSSASGDSEVFPALLAASSDPAAPRLVGQRVPHGAQTPGAVPSGKTPAAGALYARPVSASPSASAASERTGDKGEDGAADALHAPEIRVLGPIEVSGVPSTGHGPRIAQLAALLYFRPGRSADALCADMDPASPWSHTTLNARIHGLRRALGNDRAGRPYVPRRAAGEDPYRLAPAVRCDWTRFLQLIEEALPMGPAGLPGLERALALVRGRPFGAHPLPWAQPHQQEMITRIIDVARTVAAHRTASGPNRDLTLARQAIATGLDIDDSAEILYRAWIRVEDAAGNRPGLHTAIARIQHIAQTLDVPLQPETQHLIQQLLQTSGHERNPQP
ncbi:bacterial transcriptional activator domain-containing protein [Streptomyces sp. NPDC002306]